MPTGSLFSVFVFSFAIGFGAVVSPGPVSAAVVSQAPFLGWQAGFLIAAGHSVMELLVVALIASGMSTWLSNPIIQPVIAIAGELLLIWMGVDFLLGVFKKKIRLPGSGGEAKRPTSRKQLLMLDIATTMSNPFWYAWWITAATGYLIQAQALGIASVGAFFFGHISADFV